MDVHELTNILAALILARNEPVSLEQLAAVFDDWERPSQEQLTQALERLQSDLSSGALELKKLASGYVIQTKAQYAKWVAKLHAEKPVKYSRALMETLAIIAYKQPVTRGDMEEIRGVAVSSHIIKTLLEREWIKVAGHKDVPGKPAVYTTTKSFLDYFNLQHLNQLPALPAVQQECDIE